MIEERARRLPKMKLNFKHIRPRMAVGLDVVCVCVCVTIVSMDEDVERRLRPSVCVLVVSV